MKNILVISLLGLAACASKPPTAVETPVERVVVKRVPVSKPAPIVPAVTPLHMRPVEWHVLTPDNFQQKLDELGPDKAVFALTAKGYEDSALNLADLRKLVEEQKAIIAVYKRQYQ